MFFDDFLGAGAGDEILVFLEADKTIVDGWKSYRNTFHNHPYITETGAFTTCQSVADANPPSTYLGGLVDKVMKERTPTNSEQVVVGVTHPNFDGEVFIGRNFKPEESALETTFLSTDCHPILRARIKYMSFIRNSVLDPITGNIKNQILLDRLLDIDDFSKFSRAGRAGYHGEIRALSDALYKLESIENLPRGSLPESRMMEFDMFIRNSSDKVMQRCPNCFQIGNVKVLGGR